MAAVVAAVLVTAPAGIAATPAKTKAKRAVAREVRETFDTARTVRVVCRRISRYGYSCRWANLMPEPGYHDYHGRARAKVTRYGTDARIVPGVHCHFCRSGVVPWRLR